ncbi:MAG: lasso peptide biosynthesis B2 protein [Actinomycetota bacterium]|nr:lasso peptide biosynthesis B2 protein [Actinomycetota bacterium]
MAVSPGQARRLRALAVASRHWPPRGQACLRHALAVAVVLHRHHRCVIHLGVAPVSSTAPASSTVSAHAWVTVDGADLTGQGPFLALALGVGERTGASTTRS